MNRVISLRRGPLPEGVIYVGRAVPRRGLIASPFANPYPLGRFDNPRDAAIGRLAVIEAYRSWLREWPDLIARARVELAGKVLACWCAPLACHADVLVRVADGGDP